jgi:predicted outer membrane repeat protein
MGAYTRQCDFTNRKISVQCNGKVFDAGGVGRFFYAVGTDSSLMIHDCILKNGREETGGAIYIHGGSLLVSKSTFEGNGANHGGAIFAQGYGAVLKIYESVFDSNSATAFTEGLGGGAITARHSGSASSTCPHVEIYSSEFKANTAGHSGGAIEMNGGGSLKIKDSTFDTNSAQYGGAIQVKAWATVELYLCVFKSNSGSNWGGAIQVEGLLQVHGCRFIGNTAPTGNDIYQCGCGSYYGGTANFWGCNLTDGTYYAVSQNEGGASYSIPSFASAVGRDSACKLCGAGQYSVWHSNCTICGVGTYSSEPGASSADSCKACRAGTLSTPDRSSCNSCLTELSQTPN